VSSITGDIDGPIPLRRAGTFTPTLVPMASRRTGCLTVRDNYYHVENTIGTQQADDTISTVADEALEEVSAWQER